MFLRASDEYAAGKARISPGLFKQRTLFGDIQHLLNRKESACILPVCADEECFSTVSSAMPVPLCP